MRCPRKAWHTGLRVYPGQLPTWELLPRRGGHISSELSLFGRGLPYPQAPSSRKSVRGYDLIAFFSWAGGQMPGSRLRARPLRVLMYPRGGFLRILHPEMLSKMSGQLFILIYSRAINKCTFISSVDVRPHPVRTHAPHATFQHMYNREPRTPVRRRANVGPAPRLHRC